MRGGRNLGIIFYRYQHMVLFLSEIDSIPDIDFGPRGRTDKNVVNLCEIIVLFFPLPTLFCFNQ